MRKFFITLFVLAFTCSGCAWLGFGDDSSNTDEGTSTAQAEPVQIADASSAEPAPAPVATSKPVKGAKSEAQIKRELDAMGQKLVNQSARTILPNQANKEVKKVGNDWVASYVHVDTNNVRTEMNPGANGQYVGFIRYQEDFMECRGATREAALSAPCTKVRTRSLRELIRYDGKAWQD